MERRLLNIRSRPCSAEATEAALLGQGLASTHIVGIAPASMGHAHVPLCKNA